MALSADHAARHKSQVERMMRDTTKLVWARQKNVWLYIIENEILNGTHFMSATDGRAYAFLGMTGEIVSLPAGGRGSGRVMSYFNQAYGLIETETMCKHIYSLFHSYAINNGARVELRRFSAYNTETHTAYLSNYDGRMWRLDGGEPTLMDNGIDDVFFADDDGGQSTETVDIGPHGILLDTLCSLNFASEGLGGITPTQQRMALTVWLFALALPDLMPTKPLLLLEGTQGSGKSAACQLIQFALMGHSKPMILSKNKEDDFGVVLLRSPIAVFDNTDSYIEWVPDAICAYTTAGVWTKRKLFSDSDEIVLKPHAFIAIASKNPASFRREDVADRCIILRLERRAGFRRFQKLQQDIMERRPQLFGEYIHYVNEIIEVLRTTNADVEQEETTRMADFAALARAVGHVMHWAPEAVSGLMDALTGERDAFINEEDPLVELIAEWLAFKPKNGPSNVYREMTVSKLFHELQGIAQAHEILPQFCKTPRVLGQKLRSPHIERDFNVLVHVTGGHKHYRLGRKSDPHLRVVSDDTRVFSADEDD